MKKIVAARAVKKEEETKAVQAIRQRAMMVKLMPRQRVPLM